VKPKRLILPQGLSPVPSMFLPKATGSGPRRRGDRACVVWQAAWERGGEDKPDSAWLAALSYAQAIAEKSSVVPLEQPIGNDPSVTVMSLADRGIRITQRPDEYTYTYLPLCRLHPCACVRREPGVRRRGQPLGRGDPLRAEHARGLPEDRAPLRDQAVPEGGCRSWGPRQGTLTSAAMSTQPLCAAPSQSVCTTSLTKASA
jgi:hypothetical protein